MGKTKIIEGYEFEIYEKDSYSAEEMIQRSKEFYSWLDSRRSVRKFSAKPIKKSVLENIIKSASTAPSGAHKQPWFFAVVSNPELKKKIREAAEKEEHESYHSRMSEEWLKDLKPMGTDWNKPYLEIAPYLIIVFKRAYDLDEQGNKHNNYYVNESVGLACGMLLTAIHNAGLVALTHTPSPMNFLTALLERPANERPVMLIPVGYPEKETYVPKLKRKPLQKIAKFYE